MLRFLHAAIVELGSLDSRVKAELARLPEGLAYSVRTAYQGPTLHVQWKDGQLRRLPTAAPQACTLQIKSMPLAFCLFTGQMGLAQAYARHAFTLKGDIADVMRLARLVNLVEAYLFPRFISRRILTEVPRLEHCPLRLYARILAAFLLCRY